MMFKDICNGIPLRLDTHLYNICCRRHACSWVLVTGPRSGLGWGRASCSWWSLSLQNSCSWWSNAFATCRGGKKFKEEKEIRIEFTKPNTVFKLCIWVQSPTLKLWNWNYTERQKKLITSSEWRSLKSTTSKWIIFGHRYAIVLFMKNI